MGAVSTRGARRDRRLAKCNSPLYGPMKAQIPAVVRFPATGGSSKAAPAHATGRSTLPRASSGLRDGREGNCFLLRCGPAPECRRPSHQAAFAFQKVERRPDRYCSRSTRPLTLNATDPRLPVNRPLTSSYAHRRRSAPASVPGIRHRIMRGRRFVAAAAVRRGGSLRRTVPARSGRSEGSAGLFRCPRPEAAASWREDRYSRTGPCRRPPGP